MLHLVCYCLLFFAHFCHSEDCPESQKCNQVLEMEEVGDDLFEMTSKIFFIESSGRDHLLNKQICSIESAVRNSNIDKVVVTMTSKNLNLAANNATCQMFFSYQGKLLFRHVDKDKLFKGTKLEEFHQHGIFSIPFPTQSEIKAETLTTVHYSDAIRLILIHKYGGWYSDLDMMFLKPINHLENVLSSDHADDVKVSNAIFHNSKGHIFMEKCLAKFANTFNGAWASGGPILFQKALDAICNLQHNSKSSLEVYNAENCKGMQVLPAKSFFPVMWSKAPILTEKKSKKDWDGIFQDSYSVHFYDSSMTGGSSRYAASNSRANKIMRKKIYGQRMPALTYLAEENCPMTLSSQ